MFTAWRARLLWVSAAGLLAAAGCNEAYLPSQPGGAGNNPIIVQSDYDPLFEGVLRTLRDYRFVIFRQDPRLGEVVTEPLVGQQMWEFWRSDAAGWYNQIESSTHTVLRTAEVRIYPVRDQKNSPLPGQYHLEVRVHTERFSVPERELTAANQLPNAYRSGHGLVDALELEHERAAGQHPVYLGRDSALEDWLIREIVSKAYRATAPAAGG
jgi:hypothetical protein